jgi:hypothetical protein
MVRGCQAYSANEVYSKVMYKYNTYWAIFAHFTGILLELVRHFMKFGHNLGQKYFLRAFLSHAA